MAMNTKLNKIKIVIASAVMGGMLLVGCSGKASDPQGVDNAPAKQQQKSQQQQPAKDDVSLTLGDTYDWKAEDNGQGESVKGSVTVLGYKQNVPASVSADDEYGTSGYVWSALEIKTCSVEGTFLATVEPWTLSYKDGVRVEPSSSVYDDFAQPEFPFETKLTTGECVKGYITYAVPGGENPETVVYASYGLDESVEWTL